MLMLNKFIWWKITGFKSLKKYKNIYDKLMYMDDHISPVITEVVGWGILFAVMLSLDIFLILGISFF